MYANVTVIVLFLGVWGFFGLVSAGLGSSPLRKKKQVFWLGLTAAEGGGPDWGGIFSKG